MLSSHHRRECVFKLANPGECWLKNFVEWRSCPLAHTIVDMKAIVVTSFEGPVGLQFRDVPVPTPAAHEVLVQVEAVGINFADVLGALGKYPSGPIPPYIMGREFAGVTEDGRRVMGYAQHSACAEYVTAAEGLYWLQPEGWSSAQCAAFPVNYLPHGCSTGRQGFSRSPSSPRLPARSRVPACYPCRCRRRRNRRRATRPHPRL